jgi:TrmH family RNA methyltransferase
VIIAEPKYPGNIGAIARVMVNFDFQHLILINPCELTDECYARAMHASSLIDRAQVFSSFQEAIESMDFLIGTSSIESLSDKKHLRNPVLLDDLIDKIYDVEGNVGLVFGREDFGLYNEELAACDLMLRIPTSPEYLSLNLSHAVCLVLYHLYVKREFQAREKRLMGKVEKEKLLEYFSRLLDAVEYPEHKKEKTQIMFRRMMGRALPSKWEYHTLMGVFDRAVSDIVKGQKKK